AEVEGIIDDGHEEVGGRYHAPLVVQRIDSRIVPGGIAYPQPRIDILRAAAGEDGFQHLRGNLAATAGSMAVLGQADRLAHGDRKSTRLNSSHVKISYAVFCLKKKKTQRH